MMVFLSTKPTARQELCLTRSFPRAMGQGPLCLVAAAQCCAQVGSRALIAVLGIGYPDPYLGGRPDRYLDSWQVSG